MTTLDKPAITLDEAPYQRLLLLRKDLEIARLRGDLAIRAAQDAVRDARAQTAEARTALRQACDAAGVPAGDRLHFDDASRTVSIVTGDPAMT